MEELIKSRLADIEHTERIKIVYACESGSRAWGFPSADSDYDVRFIYVHPVEWYLSIGERRDVIERPIHEQLDISGWDLKKALRLLQKTNPPLLEWLGSPTIYRETCPLVEQMRQLAKDYYSPSACLYHYLHMARGNFREYLRGDVVWVKKYFYVLRPILAMKWIEHDLGIMPTDFNVALAKLTLPAELKEAVVDLLKLKLSGNELDKGPRIPAISDFIESELARWECSEIPRSPAPPHDDRLNAFFRETLRQLW